MLVSAVAATSWKKESGITPSKNNINIKVNDVEDQPSIDKSNVGTWD